MNEWSKCVVILSVYIVVWFLCYLNFLCLRNNQPWKGMEVGGGGFIFLSSSISR